MRIQSTIFGLRSLAKTHGLIDALVQFMGKYIPETGNAVNGNLGYGNGSDADNMSGQWVSVADTGNADTDFTVQHSLGSVPVGFHVMVPPGDGFIYNGATPWTSSAIYLKCSQANQSLKVFVLRNSMGL